MTPISHFEKLHRYNYIPCKLQFSFLLEETAKNSPLAKQTMLTVVILAYRSGDWGPEKKSYLLEVAQENAELGGHVIWVQRPGSEPDHSGGH